MVGSLEKCFPANLIVLTTEALQQRREIKAYADKQADFTFGIDPVGIDNNLIVILILGETARYDHFGINGYERNTTPLLAATRNLYSFDSIYSISNLTVVSVPHILSRATPTNRSILGTEKSIVSAFKEAGYATSWVANQSLGNPMIMTSTIGSEYLHYLPNDPKNIKDRDEYLIPLVLNRIDAIDNRAQFITIHSMGCHFKYNCRYPKEFKKFRPDFDDDVSIKNIIPEIKRKSSLTFDSNKDTRGLMNNVRQILVNSYDNSICYTDYFLSDLIKTIESNKRPAVILYVSDHGENLLDDENNMMLHGSYEGSYYEYHVPLLVWTSDAYIEKYPEKIEQLQKNKKVKQTTMTVFHTLIELGDMYYADFDPTLSICNELLQHQDTVYGLDANLKLKIIPTTP